MSLHVVRVWFMKCNVNGRRNGAKYQLDWFIKGNCNGVMGQLAKHRLKEQSIREITPETDFRSRRSPRG
jgi:hypothetical protein